MCKTSKTVSLLLMTLCGVLLIFLLAACQDEESASLNSSNSSAADSRIAEENLITPLSIRNSTDRGGFAILVGEKLRSEGFLYENGYTIDIGNAKRFMYPESAIWVPTGNDALLAKALELQEILGFKLISEDDALGAFEGIDRDGILILLGEAEISSPAFDSYADTGRDYPMIPSRDTTTVFRMEPYDEAAAQRLLEAQPSTSSPRISAPPAHLVIRNANGVDGTAAAAAELLAGYGFSPEVSPTLWAPMDRVTVFYQDSSCEAEALEIGAILGADEYISIAEYPGWGYLIDDITVLLGLNWVNENMLEEGQAPYPSYRAIA